MGKEITNLELLDSINRSFSNLEKKMVTKGDLEAFKLETNIHFNNLESELKSFKKDTENDIKEIKEDVKDLDDTAMHYDKRIEKLENKVFATV